MKELSSQYSTLGSGLGQGAVRGCGGGGGNHENTALMSVAKFALTYGQTKPKVIGSKTY